MTKEEMISYLKETYKKAPLIMFRSMATALENENFKSALSFYRNDKDKLCFQDRDIKNTIEVYFKENGLL